MGGDPERRRRSRKKKPDSTHSQGLGEEIEAPENNGVRVSRSSSLREARDCTHLTAAAPQNLGALPSSCAYAQVRPHEKKRKRAGDDEERNQVSGAVCGRAGVGTRVCQSSAHTAVLCSHSPKQVLDAKLTGRILKAAREQQQEVDAEAAEAQLQASLGAGTSARLGAGALAAALQRAADSSDDDDSDGDGGDSDGGMQPQSLRSKQLPPRGGAKGKQAARPQRKARGGGGEDDEEDGDELDAELRARTLQGDGGGDALVAVEEDEVSPEDEAALAAFMAPGASTFTQLSLGDLILSKLREQQQARGLDAMPE